MIDEAILLLRRHLNRALRADSDPVVAGSAEELVVLPDGSKLGDSFAFKLGAVSLVLLNLEEEHLLRSNDPYVRVSNEGVRQKTAPEIRLNLHLLLVAHFPEYAVSLRYLSHIIRHFQAHRVLNHSNAPDLAEDIDQLILELVTPSFAEQNEIWGSLRTAYRPSVLYKVRMIVFRTETGPSAEAVRETWVEARL